MSRRVRDIRGQVFTQIQLLDCRKPQLNGIAGTLALALFFLTLSLPVPHAWAAVIFVDGQLPSDCTSGNYSIAQRDCSGSDAKAYNTIQKAANVVSPGDTVQVRAGTYIERLNISTSGTANGYITFRSYLSERPVIDGQKTLPSGNGLIFLNNKAYIQLIGLTTLDSQYYGIQATGGSHDILVQDCEVMYSNHGGMVFDGGSNITIDNCDVHHNNDLGLSAWHEAITLNGVNTFEVKNSRVHNNKEEGIDAKYGSTDGSIHHNEVFSNNGPNIYVDAANNINIFSNRIHHTTGQKSGIMLSVEDNPSRYVTFNINIYNNLIYDNDSGIGFWIEGGAATYGRLYDSTIINNTIHSNNANGGLWILNGGDLSYRNVVIRNNIFWDNDASGLPEIRDSARGQLQNFTIDHNLFRTGANSNTYGTDYVTTSDPRFVDLPNYDYHLQNNSPAVDTGAATAAPQMDYDGRSRPFGAGYDIGAYEFQGTETTITSAPANPSASPTASFGFTAPEAGSTFECQLDGSGFGDCTSGVTYSGLAEGSHTFQVQATDPAGNLDVTPASYTWTVDTTPPLAPTLTAQPANPTSATSASFSFTDAEAGVSFLCKLDAESFAACTSPKGYAGPLGEGPHTFQVKARDAASNESGTTGYTWTVDTALPDTSITSAPATTTNSSNASFDFSATEAGSTFECQLDGSGFNACTSPKAYSSLADGSHTFQVRAKDAAGNLDSTPASFTWTVDTTAPVISSALASNIKKFSATIRWNTKEPADTQVEYGTTASLGQSTTLNTNLVTSHAQSLSRLSAKTTYYYRVRSRDAAGNLAVSDTFTFKTQ